MTEIGNKDTFRTEKTGGRISELSPDVQLLIWWGLFLGMFFVAQVVSSIVIVAFYQTAEIGDLAKNPDNLNPLRYAQMMATLIGFLLPALIFQRLKFGKETGFNHANAVFPMYLLLLVPAMLYTLYAVIDISFFVNKWMPWSDWMKDAQQQYKALVEAIMDNTSVSVLVLNLITVAVLPAVAEELLFRGSLQRLLTERMNIHVAVLISSVFFSLIHFEFSGFLPRVILGMFLGYLFYYTGNIMVSIFAHLVNNGAQVIFMYLNKIGMYKINMDDPVMPKTGGFILYTATFAVLWAVFIILLKKKK